MGCLDENTVAELLEGLLPEPAVGELDRHLDSCVRCRELVAAVARASSGAGAAPEAAAQGRAPGERGRLVGRYLILGLLGGGGMGRVYAAYDPDLDRRVALKLLRSDPAGTSGVGRLRLLREAQAMARLAHPNVVAVYGVETLDAEVAIAMELVAGTTLDVWLRQRPRGWREVVGIFLQAGEGLAAAHSAGLVHRDFKPSNVLVRADGRAQVTDFGLARAAEPGEDLPPAADLAGAGPAAASASVGARLTQTGALLGTPAYMAPEQVAGAPPDARADQFSFCVALYEALYGARPFAGETALELAQAALQTQVSKVVASRVPMAIRRALLRGLLPAPEARHRSMDALLVGLRRTTRLVTLVRRGALALPLVAVVAVGLWRAADRRPAALCRGAETRLEGVWDPGQKRAIHGAFTASGVPFAEGAWREVERLGDAYAARWVGARREACEATRVRGEQSEEVLGLRMVCLDRRLGEWKALSDLFRGAGADREVDEHAVAAAGALGPLEACDDVRVLSARVAPPRDAAAAARVREAQALLGRAKALEEAGKERDALEPARQAVAAARAIGYRPLEAEARFRLGHLEIGAAGGREKVRPPAEEDLEEALWAAQASGQSEIAARTSIALARLLGVVLRRHDEGLRWARRAEAPLERLGGDDRLEAERLFVRGWIRDWQQDHKGALEDYRGALALRQKVLGPEHPEVAESIISLGWAAHTLGRYEEAAAAHTRALALLEKTLGPDHPGLGAALSGLGLARAALGQTDQAIALHRRDLALREHAYGSEDPRLAVPLTNLGVVLQGKGQLAEAAALFQRALAISEKAHGREHPTVASALNNVASIAAARGRLDEAQKAFEELVALKEKIAGPEDESLARTLVNLGGLLRFQHRYQDALPYYRRALAIQEKALGPAHPELERTLADLGATYLGLEEPALAVGALERARALEAARPQGPVERGRVLFHLARALWEADRDRARARTLAATARGLLRQGGAPLKKELDEVDRWLARR